MPAVLPVQHAGEPGAAGERPMVTVRPRRPVSLRSGAAWLLAAVLAIVAAGASGEDLATRMAALDRAEDLLLALERRLPALDDSLANLALPGLAAGSLFAATVTATDLATGPRAAAGRWPRRTWPVTGAPRAGPPAGLDLWRPFLAGVRFFRHVRFKIVDARFAGGAESRFATTIEVAGLAVTGDGTHVSLAARVDATWVAPPTESSRGWRIADWRTVSFTTREVDRPLFAEVLDAALPRARDRRRARTSRHEQYIEQFIRNGGVRPPGRARFSPIAADRHPGLAVVDVNGDGLDDLYLMSRWGPNLLLVNRGDGTFDEAAARHGLDVADHTSSALFADFDNDGDPDVFLGRTLARSLYLVNEGGRFVDRSADLVSGPLPYLVSAVTAADYDGDGLLDVYFSTYGASAYLADHVTTAPPRAAMLRRYLTPEQAAALARITDARPLHPAKDLHGPPNLLLHNAGGGRFEIRPSDGPEAGWRNTYQSTWADYDGDGDPDLYLANDFAPNVLLRNDGGGRFADVTGTSGTADLGFGMGASFGDYDNDGRQDLYVTNMYSNAGRRVTAAMGDAAAELAPMARGNTLFRNLGRDAFARVSGLAPPALPVEKAGWGWGGQFVDVDNDGFLDVYALAGYYTAPKRYAVPEDI